ARCRARGAEGVERFCRQANRNERNESIGTKDGEVSAIEFVHQRLTSPRDRFPLCLRVGWGQFTFGRESCLKPNDRPYVSLLGRDGGQALEVARRSDGVPPIRAVQSMAG